MKDEYKLRQALIDPVLMEEIHREVMSSVESLIARVRREYQHDTSYYRLGTLDGAESVLDVVESALNRINQHGVMVRK